MREFKAEFVQFACEGCGTGVYMFGTNRVPANHYCLTCGFVEFLVKGNTNDVKQGMHERLGTMRKLERKLS
jgi:ribosomal protein S27E